MICIRTVSARKYRGWGKGWCVCVVFLCVCGGGGGGGGRGGGRIMKVFFRTFYRLILDTTIMVDHFHMDYEHTTYFIKLKQQNTKYDGNVFQSKSSAPDEPHVDPMNLAIRDVAY